MNIKELNKVLAEALVENKSAIKRLHEDYNSIDDIAAEVAEQIKDEYDADNEISLDTYISETIDSNGYFSYMDDVIDLYKEIATYETGIYNDLSDAVFSEIKGRVENLLADWKEENQIEESLKEAVAELGDDASEIAGKIEKEIKDAEWRKKDLKEVLAKFLAVTISYPYKPEAIYKTFIEVMTKLGKAEEGKKVIAEIKSNMDKAASVYADLMQPKINGVPVNRFELINLGNAIEQIFLKGSTTYKLKDSSLEVIKSLGLENALL